MSTESVAGPKAVGTVLYEAGSEDCVLLTGQKQIPSQSIPHGIWNIYIGDVPYIRRSKAQRCTTLKRQYEQKAWTNFRGMGAHEISRLELFFLQNIVFERNQ